MMRFVGFGIALACIAMLASVAAAREAEVTILLESFDGCGCLPPFDDPISCAECPEGVTTPHPDGDLCGPNSMDGDWYNAGWAVDYWAATSDANQGYAGQCFALAGGCTPSSIPFDENAASIIIYDNSSQAEPVNTHGDAKEYDIDAARIAQGLPEPLPNGNSYFIYDARRTDGTPQPQVITNSNLFAFNVNPHPDATNTDFEFTPQAIPDDGAWHPQQILSYNYYIMDVIPLAMVIDFEPVGAQPEAGSRIDVCYDNLRYVYTAIVPDNETECDNGIDDDVDGLTDCDDSDCASLPICTGCQHNPVFDVDDDGDVDHEDFGILQTCITGTGDPGGVFETLSEDCKCMDRTGVGGVPDNAVDQQDIAVFEQCATGPDILDPNLAECDD